jgi:hypothetical protein
MVNPADFFKSIEDNEDSRKKGVLLRYMEKVIKKHFASCIDLGDLKSIIYDDNISYDHKHIAIRESSYAPLANAYFFNEKTDVFDLMKKGKEHPVVKELINAMNEWDCDILIFPVYKQSDWVAHGKGMSDEAEMTPRIIIPGDGALITIQPLTSFTKEHM